MPLVIVDGPVEMMLGGVVVGIDGTTVVNGIETGMEVGTPVGNPVESPVGAPVGNPVGSPVGIPLGGPVGIDVGTPVGAPVGTMVGRAVETSDSKDETALVRLLSAPELAVGATGLFVRDETTLENSDFTEDTRLATALVAVIGPVIPAVAPDSMDDTAEETSECTDLSTLLRGLGLLVARPLGPGPEDPAPEDAEVAEVPVMPAPELEPEPEPEPELAGVVVLLVKSELRADVTAGGRTVPDGAPVASETIEETREEIELGTVPP